MYKLFIMIVLSMLHYSAMAADCSTGAWAQTIGVAEASTDAAYYGSCSLKITPDGHVNYLEGAAFVEDQTPGSITPPVTEYAARFYFKADQSMVTQQPAELIIFRGWLGDDSLAFEVGYSMCDGVPVVYLKAGGGAARTQNIALPAQWNEITVWWADSGEMRLRVLGAGEQAITGNTVISPLTKVQLGIPMGTLQLFTGALYFDEFASTRGTDPGPRVDICSHPTMTFIDYEFSELFTMSCKAESVEMQNVSFVPRDEPYLFEVDSMSVTGAMSVPSGVIVRVF